SVFNFSLQLADPTVSYVEEVRKLVNDIDLTNLLTDTFSELASSSTIAGGDRPRILAVDDDPINLTILVNILSLEHYDIVTVTSGKEAMKILDTQEWDLIITDVMMPHMSGYELSRMIRERFSISELPILLLT